MQNILDYLKSEEGNTILVRRPFSQVDALVLSALAYMHLPGLVPEDGAQPISVQEVAAEYFAQPEHERGRCRRRNDLVLLQSAAQSPRFAAMELAYYEDRFNPDEEMQFAAVSVFPGDGSVFLAFRGTDATFLGWKEDFNLSFQDKIAAQSAALDYLERVAAATSGAIRLGGHSKGGNLAVYAASLCREDIQERIADVYDFDGPGFTKTVLDHAGYRALLPRIHKMVPQSSVIGMLLEHEAPYTVVKSNAPWLLQHELYSWQVAGGEFVPMEDITNSSRKLDDTIKTWVAQFTPEERSQFVDAMFELISEGGKRDSGDIIRARDFYRAVAYIKNTDEETRGTIQRSLAELARCLYQQPR